MAPAVGVVVALAREARVVRRACRVAGVEARVSVACSGMGGARAGDAARDLVDRGAELLLVAGYAGALHARLAPGALLLATALHGARAGAPRACDADLLARAEAALAGTPALHLGPLASVDRPLDGAAARAALAAHDGALAVDMESAAVGEVAAQRGVPWLALRAISDGVGQRVPPCLERLVDAYGTPTPRGLLRAVLHDPMGLRHLPALARGVRHADRSLQTALVRLLAALAGSET